MCAPCINAHSKEILVVREDELLVKNVLEYFVYGRHSLEVGDDYAL